MKIAKLKIVNLFAHMISLLTSLYSFNAASDEYQDKCSEIRHEIKSQLGMQPDEISYEEIDTLLQDLKAEGCFNTNIKSSIKSECTNIFCLKH